MMNIDKLSKLKERIETIVHESQKRRGKPRTPKPGGVGIPVSIIDDGTNLHKPLTPVYVLPHAHAPAQIFFCISVRRNQRR